MRGGGKFSPAPAGAGSSHPEQKPTAIMTFTVAIIGRPNVGKSTLFNRLVGKKLALVDDQPGVTRDRRAGEAKLGDLNFTIIDTAGLEEGAAESLTGRMRAQTESGDRGSRRDLLRHGRRASASRRKTAISPRWCAARESR